MPEYVLNIALFGRHWARVQIKADYHEEARQKAGIIRERLEEAPGDWSFSLTVWRNVGEPVEF